MSNLKVLVFTSSYSKRPYMMRQIMLGVLNQTYKNIFQVVNITMDNDSTTTNHTPLYSDLIRDNLHVIYSQNQHSHINNMKAITSVPNYLDFDVYIKMDDDDIHKSRYVENIVNYFKEHPETDIVSTYINYQLNGYDLHKGPYDNLGANPGNTDYHMPMTFAFNKKAFLQIVGLTKIEGYDDNMWRNAWYKAGLIHQTVNNNDEIIWHVHGKNQSCPEFLKKPKSYTSSIS
jgi:hypothetical protein